VRHIVIGDIHGCHAELLNLLDVVGPASDDQIVAIGDVVDRGPDSLKVLEFIRGTPNAMSIVGNHERKHIRSARGETPAALSQKIVRHQLGDDYAEWLAFMESFPRHLELPEAILVHGFMEPGVPLEEQKDTVVIGTLTGERYMAEHYQQPWYDHYEGEKPVVVGHHSYLRSGEPVIREGRVYAIDTGCCHGGDGRLTALILPEFRIVSVPSRGDHWSAQRATYASLGDEGRSDLDLDWERLDGLAQSVGETSLPKKVQERAKRCAEFERECRRLVDEAVSVIGDLCAAYLRELENSDDWDACSEKKQAARYAQKVGEHTAAPLLFAARRGTLTRDSVRRHRKTPRQLLGLAQELGIETNLCSESRDDD